MNDQTCDCNCGCFFAAGVLLLIAGFEFDVWPSCDLAIRVCFGIKPRLGFVWALVFGGLVSSSAELNDSE